MRGLALLALLAAGAATAEPVALPPVTVTSPRVAETLDRLPAAASRVEAETLSGEPGLALDEALVRVPGVFSQNRYNLNQGLRVSIRGLGSRAAFGVRGLRVLLDDVPLTMPDGQTELDVLDLALLSRVEVLRGPASALYGNGAGGVLALYTRDRPEADLGRIDLRVGAFGERAARAELGAAGAAGRGLLAVARRELDGHRDNLAADSTLASARGATSLGPGELALQAQYLDITAADPGALTRAEAAQDPRRANPAALRFAASETIRQARLGVDYRVALAAQTELSLRAWAGQRDFSNRLPFAASGQTAFERRFAGQSAQLTRQWQQGELRQRLSLGADLEDQRDDRERFDQAEGGVRGDRRLSQRERAQGVGVFALYDLGLGPWSASGGVRTDRLRLSVSDRFLADGDDSGRRRFTQDSFGLGLARQLGGGWTLHARYGTGFESPTINELANPAAEGAAGGFNPALDPSRLRNTEVGLRGRWNTLEGELVAFRISASDELQRFELAESPGRSFFRNAGASRRDGLELSLKADLGPALRGWLVADLLDARFDAGGDRRSLPGLPRSRGFAELAWDPLADWTFKLQAEALDRRFANDGNTERVPGHGLANVRAVHRPAPGWELSAAVNDVFDRAPVDNLRTNAAQGRFYEPGAGRVWLLGLSRRF